MIIVTNAMLADYLTADAGDWLTVEADGSYNIVESSLSHRGMTYAYAVRCPGINNLDSGFFSDDFASYEDGVYRAYDGSFEGDLEALIRFCVFEGDVEVLTEDLEAALERDFAAE